jgi:hypothetical protein
VVAVKVLVVGARATDKGRVYVNYIVGDMGTTGNEVGLQFPKVRNVAAPAGATLGDFAGVPNVYEVQQDLREGRDGPYVVLVSIRPADGQAAAPSSPVPVLNGSV